MERMAHAKNKNKGKQDNDEQTLFSIVGMSNNKP